MSEAYLDEFLYCIGCTKSIKTIVTKRNKIKRWLQANEEERLLLHRSVIQIRAIYDEIFGENAGGSQSRKSMIDDMLEKWEDDKAVEGTNSYFLGRSDLTCGCDKCRKGNWEDCVSPFKKYMRHRNVKIKEWIVDEEAEEEEDNQEE